MDNFTSSNTKHYASYYEEDSVQSEIYHRKVIAQLEKKLNNNPTCVGSICDWIASYHELAAIYQRQGHLDMAQQCLYTPHQSMLYMAQNYQGNEDKRLIAIKAIGLTLPPLLEFSESHPPCEHCMEELQAQLVLIESLHETHH